jgi:hypothetical protein
MASTLVLKIPIPVKVSGLADESICFFGKKEKIIEAWEKMTLGLSRVIEA